MLRKKPTRPIHVPGTRKGEEFVQEKGREPGRSEDDPHGYRSARDATSVSANHRAPIDPRMPNIPPQ